MQGTLAQLIEASMADLARSLEDREAPPAREAAPAAEVEIALRVEPSWLGAPRWAGEPAWPVEPAWPDAPQELARGSAPVWHTAIEDGVVVATTDDVRQLDRSVRVVTLDIS